MKGLHKVRGWFIFTALSLTLGGSLAQAQGVPEPPMVFYGTIRNAGQFNRRETSGVLTWRFTSANSVRAMTNVFTTALASLGALSCVLDLPCESGLPFFLSSDVKALAFHSGFVRCNRAAAIAKANARSAPAPCGAIANLAARCRLRLAGRPQPSINCKAGGGRAASRPTLSIRPPTRALIPLVASAPQSLVNSVERSALA